MIEDYKYSKALTAYDKNWTFEELNGFLIKPAKWIKGTKMAYAGPVSYTHLTLPTNREV